MKIQYIKPETSIVSVELQQIMVVSGVENTSSFSGNLTEETTDQALSRHYSVWGDVE